MHARQTTDLGRLRSVLLAVALVAAVYLALPYAAHATTPGTPGAPQAGTLAYLEDFQNAPGTTASDVTTYTGSATADGETYTADPYWTPAGNNCNGFILSAGTSLPAPTPAGCSSGAWGALQDVTTALGELEGESATQAASNFGLSEWTSASGAPGIELATSPNRIPAGAGHFYDVRADYGVIDYSGGGAGCATLAGFGTADDPQINLYLVSGSTRLQVGSQLDPCTAAGNHDLTVGGRNVRVAQLVSNAIQWTGGSSMGVEQDNASGTGNAGNDGATDNIQIVDVTPQLDKSFSPATPNVGQSATLTFTITNTSELGAKDGWSFTDSLPSGLVVANPAGASTTCSGGPPSATAGGTSVSMTGNLDQGQASCTVSVKVTSSTAGTYTNGPANVSASGLNPPGSSTVQFLAADLSLTKTASPSPAVPGTNETYTLAVKNNGPDAAQSVVVSDPLPSGLTFVSAGTGCSYAAGKVTCTQSSLASGSTASFSVVGHLASSLRAGVVNTATVTSSTPDLDLNNNSSTASAPLGPKADLQIVKTASTGSVMAGGQVMYTLVVNNDGPSNATGATVSDTLPTGMSVVSAAPTQGLCTTGLGITCHLGTIAAGGSAQVLVTANVAATAAGSMVNSATVVGQQPDPDPGNNSSSATVTVVAQPAPGAAGSQPVSDIQVAKTVNRRTAYPGQVLTYTVSVTNHGPDVASNVNVTDASSLSLKVLSAKPSQGSCHSGRPTTCSLGTLANGAHATIKVSGEVMATGSEGNTASATSAGRDADPTNNLDAARSAITAQLRLRKTATPRSVKAGGTIAYRLALTNPNAIAVHGVAVCDRLPLGLEYLSARPKPRLRHGQQCWRLGTVGAHRSRTIKLMVRALKGTSGRRTNQATATAPGARTARARTTVRVRRAPRRPTPVTG